MKMVYNEFYGELSYAQRAAYRKHNVTPADHNDLAYRFGEDNHAGITAAIKQCVADHGRFDIYLLIRGTR